MLWALLFRALERKVNAFLFFVLFCEIVLLLWMEVWKIELPAEGGLAVEHGEAIGGAGAMVGGLAHEPGGRGIVDQIVDQHPVMKVFRPRPWTAVAVGPCANGSGVDQQADVGKNLGGFCIAHGARMMLGCAADMPEDDAFFAQGIGHRRGCSTGAEDEGSGAGGDV